MRAVVLRQNKRSHLWFEAALCGVCLTGGAALAQQADEGGARSTITTSMGLTAGRNLDLDPGANDTTDRLNGVLGYTYQMRTRQTDLSFTAQVRPEKEDGDDAGFYPAVGLDLTHEAARTRFSLGANYGEARVTDQSLGFDADTGAIIEYSGTGTRAVTTVQAGVEGGIDMPLGYSLGLTHTGINYRDMSAGSSYYDSTTDGVKAGLRADVSAMTSLSLNLGHRRYAAENPQRTTRTTDSLSFGLDQRVSALTMLNASVGRERIETERRGDETEKTSGMIYGLGVTRDDPLGSYQLNYNRSITENGQRDSVIFGRKRETQFGNFLGTIGISKGEESDADWIGSLAYGKKLPRDVLSAKMSRAVQTNDDGDDVVVTRISGSVSHAFSDLNSVNLGLMASGTEYPERDKTRFDATVSYQHLLTRDVSLEAGVRFGMATQTDREDADSQSLFLTVSRQFEFLN